MLIHTHDPSTWEVEAEGFGGEPGLHSETSELSEVASWAQEKFDGLLICCVYVQNIHNEKLEIETREQLC